MDGPRTLNRVLLLNDQWKLRPYVLQILLLAVALAVVTFVVVRASAQAPVKPMARDAHPSFAVATIKPHDPNFPRRQGWNFIGERVQIQNQTIAGIMMYAYSINPHQLAGLPEWADNAAFDIEGVTDTPGQPNLPQQQEMLQKLLADRFGLRFHREQRPLNVYAIQIAKGGPKLTPAAHPDAQPTQRGNQQGASLCNKMGSAAMTDFVLVMQYFVEDRPLVDQTGLTGRYDITLCYTPDEVHSTDPNAPPGLFTAVQEQLGLKFEPIKAPVDVFVIDHVDRPSAN
jgi:uncharacterized protein (TIGR03435 family)